jgi:hypothetical protein
VIPRDPVIGKARNPTPNGAQSLKSTPIWDHMGYGGMSREGGGQEIARVAGIAKIDYGEQTLPLINADIRRSGMESAGLMGDRR